MRNVTKENLISAYTEYLENKYGKEFYNDIHSVTTAKDDAEYFVTQALINNWNGDNFIAEHDIKSLEDFVETMGRVYTDGYCSIDGWYIDN